MTVIDKTGASAEEFEARIAPFEADDCDPDCQERTECERAGRMGHAYCGGCPNHEQPRHHCGCPAPAPHAKGTGMGEGVQ